MRGPVDIGLADAASASLAAVLDREERILGHFPVPGGVIAITDVDGVLAEVAFGYADPRTKTPMTSGQRFEIGSISKVLVSLVVNDLIDGGHLTLDTVVGDVVPWLAHSDRIGVTAVGALLSHTAGLSIGSDALPDDAAEIAAGLSFTTASTPSFHYSNVGYMVLGEVVRAITGERVASLIGSRWLDRLAMTDSASEVIHGDRSRLVPGFRSAHPGRPWAPGDPLEMAPFFEVDSASGNIASTPADLAALGRALLRAELVRRGGSGRSPISVASWTRMIETLATGGEMTYDGGADAVTSSRYGLGINVELVGGHHCVSHGGGMVGYSTFLLVDLDLGLGVAVLTNANGNSLAAHVLARHALAGIRSIARGDEWRFDLDVRCREMPPDWLGCFEDESGESIAVVMRDGLAVVRYRDREGPLYSMPYGRLVTGHPDLRGFHLDRIDLPELNGWAHGPRVFTRGGTGPDDLVNPKDSLVGHYRSYSPWFPEFRIISRLGGLHLVAGDGVEAPFEEQPLFNETGRFRDTYRIGAADAPERLVVQSVRDGEVIRLTRDGCAYSRAFSA